MADTRKRPRANPDRRNQDGETALFVAARGIDVDAVRALLEAGADPNSLNGRGRQTPVHAAAFFSGNPAVLKTILEAGGRHGVNDRLGCTALHEAAMAGNAAGLLDLLEAGADVDAQDIKGQTPLHNAAFLWDRAVQILLEAGSRPETQDAFGRPALFFAVMSASPERARLLIEAGAEPGVRDHNGNTSLHWTARSRAPPAMIRLLLEAGADPHARNDEGATPLDLALRDGRSGPVVDLLQSLEPPSDSRHAGPQP